MRTQSYSVVLGLLVTTLGACAASLPPQDLVSARNAYSRANNDGTTGRLNPSDLDAAHKQLNVAEASFEENGDTQHTRDQSYLALRRTEYAEVIARRAPILHLLELTLDYLATSYARLILPLSSDGQVIDRLITCEAHEGHAHELQKFFEETKE